MFWCFPKRLAKELIQTPTELVYEEKIHLIEEEIIEVEIPQEKEVVPEVVAKVQEKVVERPTSPGKLYVPFISFMLHINHSQTIISNQFDLRNAFSKI